MIILGLTGSIGMGKSTVAEMFQYHGCPVQDADKVVHDLMSKNGDALAEVEAAFPGVTGDNGIDRQKLGSLVFGKPEELRKLEAILYPWVDKKRADFLADAEKRGADIAVLDIPLLFEKGLDKKCDVTVCVRAPDLVQKQRVMARPGMTEEKFKSILAEQLPIRQKMAKSDFVIQTGLGKGRTMKDVKDIVAKLLKKNKEKSDAGNRTGHRNNWF